MGDWAIIRLDVNNPEEGELVKIIANVPLDWNKYLTQVIKEHGKEGRYLPVYIMYDKEKYHPESLKDLYEQVERDSSC